MQKKSLREKASPPRPARLFSEPPPPAAPDGVHVAYIDGAARGNPGPASYGVVVLTPAGEKLETIHRRIGASTNNVAEYYALISALDWARAHHISKLRVRSDSELIVNQMHGSYKVKSHDLRPLFERASKLSRALDYFDIEYVPREMNREADALANIALDDSSSREPAPALPADRKRPFNGSPSLHRSLRARYSQGRLHPVEPLDLPEGAEVELDLRILKK